MDPGPRVVASWLWAVVNPQIEHCEYEQELLARTLTFRAYNQAFERLRHLRQALLPEGREIFDDIHGEIPGYDETVARHDQTLNELHRRAVALSKSLVENDAFAVVVERCIAELRVSGVKDLPNDDERPHDIKYLAEYVVNDIADLSHEYSLAVVYNAVAGELKRAAPAGLLQSLRDGRDEFVAVVVDTKSHLGTLRKKWSRRYDIPVAPVPGLAVEASSD